MTIEKSLIDVSAHIQEFTAACENAFNGLALGADIWPDMVDASTQTPDVAVSRNQDRDTSITRISSQRKEALRAGSALSSGPALDYSTDDMIEVLTQKQGVLSQSGIPSEATLVDNPSESPSPSVPQQELDEEEIRDERDLPKATSFSIETMALVNAALNQNGYQKTYGNSAAVVGLEKKEQEESGGMEPTPEVQNSGDSVSFQCNVQNGVENTAAAEVSTMEQEDLLRAEQAAHQEIREALSRLDEWCNLVEDENTRFREQIEDTQRETRRMQRQLHNAEDESTRIQTRLSGAEGQIQDLVNSTKLYLSTIERLQAQVVNLNANVSRYTQLGTNFYGRLQNAEKFMNPEDGLFAAYKRLMSDAARYFCTPASAGGQDCRNGYVHDDDVRFEELDETDDNEEDGSSQESDQENDQENIQENNQENDQEIYEENDGAYMLGKSMVTRDHMPAGKVNAIHSDDDIAPMDDDDSTYPHRPMRPGTANRVPRSVFAARSGHAARSPSSSVSEDSAQQGRQASEEAAPAFAIDFNFSASSEKSEQKSETTAVTEPVQEPAEPAKEPEYNAKASNTSVHGRRGIERGWAQSGRGTTRVKMPLRASRGTRSGNGRKGTNAGAISSPASASTAFPINYGFAERSVNTDSKREATTRGAFGSQKSESPSPAQSKPFETASEVEQTQTSAQEGRIATSVESNPEFSATSIASPNTFSSSGSHLQPSASSTSTPAMEANNSPSSLDLHSWPPQATPPTQQTINIFSSPAQYIEEQSQSSVSTSRVTEQAGDLADRSLNSVGVELIRSKNTEDGLREARAGKAKATRYAPDPPKWLKWNWEPFSPKPPKKVPPVWMPVSPTIRPFEFENRKGESSKSQRSGAAQEEAHVAKVKGWIASIAPRKTSKKTGRRQNERNVGQEDVGGHEQSRSDSSPQNIVHDDGNKEPAKTNLGTGSTDQRDKSHQPLGMESAATNDDGPPTQTEEVYTSPYTLAGAFKFENAPRKKRYIPPWSLRYRKS